MAFQYPVHSQLEAQKFLKEAVKHCTGKILIGGHSKGGNLAVSSALNCNSSIKNRIECIYSHDGPGFLESVLNSKNFKDISSKIEKTLPQSSLVGMLLENQENFNIIKSNRVSFLQHYPFSWIVENNDFCYLKDLTTNARFLDTTLNKWISSLSNAERERFVDSLYKILNINQNSTLTEFRCDWKKNLPAIIQATSKMDEDTKSFLQETVKALFALGFKSFPELFKI